MLKLAKSVRWFILNSHLWSIHSCKHFWKILGLARQNSWKHVKVQKATSHNGKLSNKFCSSTITTSSVKSWSREIKKWKRRHYKWCSKTKKTNLINRWKREVLMRIASVMKKMEWLMRSEWQWSSQKKNHKMIWLDKKWNMVKIRSFNLWMRLTVLKWQWKCQRMTIKLVIHQPMEDQISKIWWWTLRGSNKYYKWVNRKKRLDLRNRKRYKLMKTSCWWGVYNNLKRRAPKKNNSPSKKKICFNKSSNCH